MVSVGVERIAADSSAVAVIHFARVRASSKSRAFWIAKPAVDARPRTSSSSSAVNDPRRAFVRYRLPNTSPRTRTGAPRKESMRG